MEKIAIKRRDVKILISNDIVEVYEYRFPISVERRNHDIIKGSKKEDGKRFDNLQRSRAEIRRYIWCNITPFSKFVTLTYEHTCLDYDQVVLDFKMFIKNLKRKGFSFPWLYVTEHQKERGLKEGNEGSLHIHAVFFTDEFIHYDIIHDCWKKGGVDIHSIDHVNNLGAYVCKYLTKDEFDLYEKNSYHISRGLKKPIEICHDGYFSDPEFSKDILASTDFYFIHTNNFEYELNDHLIKNSVICRQGRLKPGVKVKDVDLNKIDELLQSVPDGMEIESINLQNGYSLKLTAGIEEINNYNKEISMQALMDEIAKLNSSSTGLMQIP